MAVVNLSKFDWKSLLKCARVGPALRAASLRCPLQALRTEKACEERRQILNGRVNNERILRSSIRGNRKQAHHQQHTLHRRTYRGTNVIQNSELRTQESRIKNDESQVAFLILNS